MRRGLEQVRDNEASCGVWLQQTGYRRRADGATQRAVTGYFGLSKNASYQAADEFEGASVDDVSGPVLEMVGRRCIGGRGRELEGGDGDLVGAEEEEGAERSAGAGDVGEQLRGDGIDHAHEGAEDVVNDLPGLLFILVGELAAGRRGDLASNDFGGTFLLGCLFFLLLLLVLDF